jgi:hypothetical protein
MNIYVNTVNTLWLVEGIARPIRRKISSYRHFKTAPKSAPAAIAAYFER